MTKREMISLLIKLMGIYALVQLVPGAVQGLYLFAMGVSQYREASGGWFWVAVLSTFLAPAVWIWLCLWVIRKSDRWAERLYPEDAPASQLTTLDAGEVQRLGYHFIGLILIVQSLPRLMMSLHYVLVMLRDQHESRRAMAWSQNQQGIMLILQLAIGLYLFLRPHGLANLWKRMQGQSKPFGENADS